MGRFGLFRSGVLKNANRRLVVFLLRNFILYFLLYNAFLHLKDILNLVFFSVVFVIAVIIGLWTERARLRFLPSLIVILVLPFVLRFLFFIVFRLEQRLSPGIYSDFLNLFFDTNFYPLLFPFYIVCLLNFLALRNERFISVEVVLNSLFLIIIFWSESNFRVTLYSHPVIIAILITLFVIVELIILLLGERRRFYSVFSFVWIVLFIAGIILFFLFGKYSEGAVKTGGGLMKPTFFRFDFSKYIKLESEIELSNDLVMLFKKEGPSERILLRRFVLSGYSKERGFFVSNDPPVFREGISERALPTTVPDSPIVITDPGYRGRADVSEEFFFINFDPSSLVAMNYPVRVVPLTNWDASSFLRIYRVYSRVTTVLPLELDDVKAPVMLDDALDYYTDYGSDEVVKELALKVTEGTVTYFEKVKAIEGYLKDNFLYSLKPGIAEDGNQLHHFLFVSKKGYCSYFAFAMALMCRSIGIPARVAVGFFVNPSMGVLNFYEVRANQAHAWVEVYFNDYGWIEFDPTSENLAPGENLRFGFDMDMNRLARLIEEILKNQNRMREESASRGEIGNKEVELGRIVQKGLKIIADLWYIVLPFLYLLFVLITKFGCYIRFLFTEDIKKRTRFLYCHVIGLLYGLGYLIGKKETKMEYAYRLRTYGVAVEWLTLLYLKSVFNKKFDSADYSEVLQAYREAIKSIRRSFPWFRLIWGIVNPLHSLKKRVG